MTPVTRARSLAAVVKAYDIRGTVTDHLDTDLLGALGWATARHMAQSRQAGEVVIGHDMRPESGDFAAAFAAGVAAAGLTPRLLGLCSTDQLYFASGELDLPGAMITASHNPAGHNGVKICSPGAGGITRRSGLDRISQLALTAPAVSLHEAPAPDAELAARIAADFARRVRELSGIEQIHGLRVVVDCGNGMAGKLLDEIFGTAAGLPAVDFEVIGLYTELDGTFPNHEANPLDPANLVDLCAAVLEHGADLGLAFDGDADRCFFVDETGTPLSASAIGALVAEREVARALGMTPGPAGGRPESGIEPATNQLPRVLIGSRPTPVVLHNLITSRAVAETVRAAGGHPVRTPVGHSVIKSEMRRHRAVFAAEHSAHYYFRDFYCADSGILAACHVLTALAGSPAGARATVSAYDPYHSSGEINSTVADPAAALAAVEAAARAGRWGQVEVDHLDGVFVSGETFWLSVRQSNTEPLVRLNVEARAAGMMEEVRDSALQLVRQVDRPPQT